MLGQREKIIVIFLKSVLDFLFGVIMTFGPAIMTKTYFITNGVNDTTDNQTKTDEKTAFWYSWVH